MRAWDTEFPEKDLFIVSALLFRHCQLLIARHRDRCRKSATRPDLPLVNKTSTLTANVSQIAICENRDIIFKGEQLILMKIPEFTAKFFDGTTAFSVPELAVQPQFIYWVQGANGSGKSTLLRCLHGILEGDNPVALLDQNFGHFIFEYHRVWWNVAIPLLTKGVSHAVAKREATRVLREFDLPLDPDRIASTLSGGEQHILFILRIFLAHPYVLLVDEPTAALDQNKVQSFWRILSQSAIDGAIVVLVSHDPPPFKLVGQLVEFDGIGGKKLSISKLEPTYA